MTDRDDPLEAFFDAGRRNAATPTDALYARIEADAGAELEARARPVPSALPGRSGGWRGVLASLGGWPAGAGLGSAALAGLALGFLLPETLTGFEAPFTETLSFEEGALTPSYGMAWLDVFEE